MAQHSDESLPVEKKEVTTNVGTLPARWAPDFVSFYSNHVELRVSPGDVRLLFCHVTDGEEDDLIVKERKAAIVMSPQNALAFALLLSQSVKDLREMLTDFVPPPSPPENEE